MSKPSAEVEFRPPDIEAVADHMARLSAEHRGWINLQPGFDEDDAPARASGVMGLLFASSVHDVPVCTWVAGHEGRNGLEPDELGVQHAAGARIVAELARRGLPVPVGWQPLQDHPRHGLVLRPPVGTSLLEQLQWLLAVGAELSSVPLTGEWLASVFEGR
ncbi:MAG: hypothetical protein ACYDD4_09150 [Acidimicrobiales bacterium]